MTQEIELTADLIHGFVGSCLVKRFDGSLKTPEFHHILWEYFTSKNKYVAVAAPRSHAKSTAGTLSFTLASILFRQRDFVVIVSDSEAQASLFLGNIKNELKDNKDIIELFGLKKDKNGEVIFEKDSETDIIVEFDDGYQAKILAKGSEQKLRGLLWKGKRPNLIICHEEGTDVYTPETGWIKNQDYPESKKIFAHEVYDVEFEDGHIETVTADHQFFVSGKGWIYPWMMKSGDNVEENITDDIMNDILKEEKKLINVTTISQKLKSVLKSGLRIIVMLILLQKSDGKTTIKNTIINKLKNTVRKILVSWRSAAQLEEAKRLKLLQAGYQKMICG